MGVILLYKYERWGLLEQWDFYSEGLSLKIFVFTFFLVFFCVYIARSSASIELTTFSVLLCSLFLNFLFYFFFSLLIYGVVFTLGNLFVFQIRMFVKKCEQANGNLIVTWKSIIGLRPFADFNFNSILYYKWLRISNNYAETNKAVSVNFMHKN